MLTRVHRCVPVVALLAALLVPVAASRAVNLLTNGGFETGNFSGWTVVGTAGVSNTQGRTEGNFAVAMNGGNLVGSMVLSQTVATVPGTLYRLEFDHGVFGATQTQTLNVNVMGAATLVNTGVSDTATNPTTFLRRYFDFVADSVSTTLTFTDTATVGQSNSADGNLDRVSIDLTPAVMISPGGMGALGLTKYINDTIATPLNGAVAMQNTTGFGGVASRAIDGNTNGAFGGASVTHTSPGAVGDNWTVTLPDEYAIDRVVVFNRSDCCSERLTEFNIDVLNSATGLNVITAFDLGTPGNGNTGGVPKTGGAQSLPSAGIQHNLPPNTIGDAVRVVQNAAFPLSLAEVQVFGLGSLSMNSIDSLVMDIGPGGMSDFLDVQGAANLQGTLVLKPFGGYEPVDGSFVLLTASTINVGALVIDDPFLGNVVTSLDIIGGRNGQQLVLNVDVIPEPATATLGLMSLALLALRRRRAA